MVLLYLARTSNFLEQWWVTLQVGNLYELFCQKWGGGIYKELSSEGGVGGTYTGYGLQLTYDVPLGQYNGVLCVRVCWHDVVYLAEVNFAQKAFAF